MDSDETDRDKFDINGTVSSESEDPVTVRSDDKKEVCHDHEEAGNKKEEKNDDGDENPENDPNHLSILMP